MQKLCKNNVEIMHKLCNNYAHYAYYAEIMQKLCKKNYAEIMQKLCKNYAKIMQKLCNVPGLHNNACIMQKLCKLCKNYANYASLEKLCKLCIPHFADACWTDFFFDGITAQRTTCKSFLVCKMPSTIYKPL